jgi:UMF1 family MFS transporter
MFANVGFGASIVAMNAYLPTLAAASPKVAALREQLADLAHDTDNAEEPLLHHPELEASARRKQYDTELSKATSRISSLGVALGYGAGIILLLVALIPVTKLHGSTFSLRLAIGLSGIWWALFSIPAALWLPGASTTISLDEDPVWVEPSAGVNKPETWSLRSQVAGAWSRLGAMLSWNEIKRLRNTFRYLAAWFLLSDGQCLLDP